MEIQKLSQSEAAISERTSPFICLSANSRLRKSRRMPATRQTQTPNMEIPKTKSRKGIVTGHLEVKESRRQMDDTKGVSFH